VATQIDGDLFVATIEKVVLVADVEQVLALVG